MTVAPLIYPLPALLGYLLFVGISGRFDPLSRPEQRADRPSWLLGLWSGVALTLVLAAGLVAVHGQSPGSARALLAPSGWALAALMLPGLALWHVYRGRVVREDDAPPLTESGAPAPAGSLPELAERDRDAETNEPSGPARDSAPPVAAFLSRIASGRIDVPDIPVAPSELADQDDRRGADEASGTECVGSRAPFARGDDSFGLALREEKRLRAETEKHLRITRRALGVLAGESSWNDKERVDVLISLEKELESRIRESVATEAALHRATARCAELERKLAKLSQDTLSARHAARRGDEARARAVGAATRSLTLARQAIRTRAQAEERLRESEERLAARQATIGSLVSALEQARSRSRSAAPGTEDLVTNGTTAVVAAGAGPISTFREDEADALMKMKADNRLGARLARKATRVRPLTSQG